MVQQFNIKYPTCPVEVKHRVEWARVPVEEVLVVYEGVGVAVLQDALVVKALHGQSSQPRPTVNGGGGITHVEQKLSQ